MLENEGIESSESSQEVPQESLESTPNQAATPEPQAPIDLDKVERFTWGGRELTPKELQAMVLMQSDYTRKTQQISEERKYYDNLEHDLAAVRDGRATPEQFMSVYPAKFHSFVGYVQKPQGAQMTQAQKPGVDPDFMREFKELREDMNQRRVQAAEAQIEATFKTMEPKYPLADSEAVIARAQVLLDRLKDEQGDKATLTNKHWDEIFKTVHERNRKLMDTYRSSQMNAQKQVNVKGRDVPSGGGIPGQAPKMPKTLKEASAMALQEINNS